MALAFNRTEGKEYFTKDCDDDDGVHAPERADSDESMSSDEGLRERGSMDACIEIVAELVEYIAKEAIPILDRFTVSDLNNLLMSRRSIRS